MSHSIGRTGGVFVSPRLNEATMDAGRNFFSGFTVNYILHSANPGTAVVGGVVSAIASLIDCAIRPLLVYLFGLEFQETIEESVIRNVVVLSIVSATSIAAAPYTGMKIAVNILATLSARTILSMFDERFVGQSTVVI